MGFSVKPLTGGLVPVIIFGMDTMRKLRELFKAGWSLQVAPEVSAFGVIYATVVWSLKRSEIDSELDGPLASLPMISRVNLADPAGFDNEVSNLYARVFPISPDGLGDALPDDSPFLDL